MQKKRKIKELKRVNKSIEATFKDLKENIRELLQDYTRVTRKHEKMKLKY